MPKQLKPADGETPLVSLAGADAAEPTELVPMDRSTVELWLTCPMQARLMEMYRYLDAANVTETGTAVHAAYGKTIKLWLDQLKEPDPEEGPWHVGTFAKEIMNQLADGRPDTQPEAIDAGKAGRYTFAKIMFGIPPLRTPDGQDDIKYGGLLRYSGGQGNMSGQLSKAMPAFGVVLTTELDLLYTESDRQLVDWDLKSGRVACSPTSFQFQFHSVVVMANYPTIERLKVKILGTRQNKTTWDTIYHRDELYIPQGRIARGLEQYMLYHDCPIEKMPIEACWPTVEKCELCPGALDCPASGKELTDIAADPGAAVDRLVVLQEQVARMKKGLNGVIDKTGTIVSPNGTSYGRDAPKKAVKPTAKTYTKPKGE